MIKLITSTVFRSTYFGLSLASSSPTHSESLSGIFGVLFSVLQYWLCSCTISSCERVHCLGMCASSINAIIPWLCRCVYAVRIGRTFHVLRCSIHTVIKVPSVFPALVHVKSPKSYSASYIHGGTEDDIAHS